MREIIEGFGDVSVGTSNEGDVIKLKLYKATHSLAEIFRVINELPKLGDIKVNELIEVRYGDPVESGGVDSCREVLQILANTAELEVSESRKECPCDVMHWACRIGARSRRLEPDVKISEPSQGGKSGDHRLG
jgi:hypothetical protein